VTPPRHRRRRPAAAAAPTPSPPGDDPLARMLRRAADDPSVHPRVRRWLARLLAGDDEPDAATAVIDNSVKTEN
jgi:hypothetical protein